VLVYIAVHLFLLEGSEVYPSLSAVADSMMKMDVYLTNLNLLPLVVTVPQAYALLIQFSSTTSLTLKSRGRNRKTNRDIISVAVILSKHK